MNNLSVDNLIVDKSIVMENEHAKFEVIKADYGPIEMCMTDKKSGNVIAITAGASWDGIALIVMNPEEHDKDMRAFPMCIGCNDKGPYLQLVNERASVQLHVNDLIAALTDVHVKTVRTVKGMQALEV